jgi:NAD-dependent SIR2 family protein deacetylase
VTPLDGSMVARAAEAISGATALLFTAGAGMGVDSGLPDFRGPEGFWRAYPPYRALGLPFEELANPRWFAKDPAFAWGFYGHRMELYRRTIPHDGFRLLKAWGERVGRSFVFTSNVDGQFHLAGFDPNRIVECHGTLRLLQCTAECGVGIVSSSGTSVDVDPSTFRAREPLPVCPRCGSLARPNVLMFGDGGFDGDEVAAQEERMARFLDECGPRLTVIECGAGTHIPSVRSQGERLLRVPGTSLVRINPRESQGPAGTVSLAGGALASLQAIGAQLGWS